MSSNIASTVYFRIPDTLRSWPWPRRINPHYAVCKKESSAWCESFSAFSPEAQSAFNRCDFNLLAALAYPLLNKDGCRVGCDLMNLFFVFDEYSDIATERCAQEQANIIMDALRNPHVPRPAGEWVGGEITREFWKNAVETASETAQRHFISAFQQYTDAVVQQAEDRAHHRIRDIKSYFEIRRHTIGAKPSFSILQIHMTLPDNVLQDPTIERLTAASIDMIIIGNDLYSYNVEQARGDDGHNLVTIVMQELRTDVDGAFEWISKLHDQLAEQFLSSLSAVKSFGEPNLDVQVAAYIDGLGNWVRANDSWSFESQRYFGTRGLETQKSRVVALLPNERPSAESIMQQYVATLSVPAGVVSIM